MIAIRGMKSCLLVLSIASGCGSATSLTGAAGSGGGNTGIAGTGGKAATGGASGGVGGAGTGGARVDAGAPSSSDGASDATDATASACTSHETVAPVSTVATYTAWAWPTADTLSQPVCLDGTLMRRLLSCDAVAVPAQYGLRSEVLRVAERRADTCLLEFWSDVEGSDDYWTCELPLPLAPWAGLQVADSLPGISKDLLEGIRDKCTRVGTCCIAFCAAGSSCDPTYVPPPRP